MSAAQGDAVDLRCPRGATA
uniref:Uncharacterized protein n=1 Tax=Arundo donax TaxID=35708 RepID=A0A0A8Y4V5_ARUDO